MRELRRLLRELLQWVPGTFGKTVLLPNLQHIYERLPLLEWRTKRYELSEVRRIRRALSGDISQFTIVLDYQVIDLSYGTLLFTLPIARYVISQGVHTNLYIVDTDYLRQDISDYSQDEIRSLTDDFVSISKALLDSEMGSVHRISSNMLPEILTSQDDEFLLFSDSTRSRRPFFRHCFNVFNFLMADTSESYRKQILFSIRDFEKYFPKTFDLIPYVSWGCRYSLKGTDADRQTMPDEFRASYDYLKDRFPDHNIVIVSDVVGCDHYSAIAKDLEIDDLLFSKDFTTDFLGDAALVMRSDFFFWFRAGGMSIIPLISEMPYECLGPLMNERMWDRKRLTSWQEDSQRWVNLQKHQFVDDRSFDIEKIGSYRTGPS